MKILHISTECYPAAKAGGMGDVVGALPIYLPNEGVEGSVILPKYGTKWIKAQSFTTVNKGSIFLDKKEYIFRVQKLKAGILAFDFYVIDVPELFDRENIYLGKDGNAYEDEMERYLTFQLAVIEWLVKGRKKFDGLHCHDHMTALITFLIQFVPAYEKLKTLPTFFTIHNGMYRGVYDWDIISLLPSYNREFDGMLEWDEKINSLATALKCAWAVNTVSPSYMNEIALDSETLTSLYISERSKCIGILNGIDEQLWNPETDKYLQNKLVENDWQNFKKNNRDSLNKEIELDNSGPLMGFIGRLAHQKGADVLVTSIRRVIAKKDKVNFIILGSGDKTIEEQLLKLQEDFPKKVCTIIAYDEVYARRIYAACNFLLMPSRFEPCGLNQLYSYRYGTIPIVTKVGGLIDTVPDISNGGTGISTTNLNSKGFAKAIKRGLKLYKNKKKYTSLLNQIIKLDFSWRQSAKKYKEMYSLYIK